MTARSEALAAWLSAHETEAVAFLEEIVNQDSGTYDRAGVNRVADRLAQAYAELGYAVERVRQPE
jgi:glutamate carboxypeptidase